MATLFDKVIGTSTSFDSEGITDTNQAWIVDQFKGWFVVIDSATYQITSNTTEKLLFSNSIASNFSYSIEFVSRTFLTEIESDASDIVKIPDSLLSNKYNQANSDVSKKVFVFLRGLYSDSFDPLASILNLDEMQQTFAYFVLGRIYQDLMIDQESFESFKGYNMYEKSYNDSLRDSLSLLQIDFNKDGEVNAEELTHSAATLTFLGR